MYIKVFKTFCFAPQTEIPLTWEMSRSDKRVTARYEQLEPVTLNLLSATAVVSLYRYDKQFTGLFCLRQITAAFRYCNAVSQVRELCRGADRNKKTAHRAIFLFGASNRDSPDRGNVTK